MRIKAILFAASAIIILGAVESRAVDVSVGATTWYSAWDFKQKNQDVADIDPALMFGPVLSFGFNKDWSWSNVILYGKFKMHQNTGPDMTLKRLDIDSTLNYNINRTVKLFTGVKFMQYTDTGFYHRSAGPAAGIGVTLPLTDSLFVLGTFSGIYMRGSHKNPGSSTVTGVGEPGINTTLALAYYIDSISTTVTLGGRYQYFKSFFDNHDENEDITHHFYGVTLSAIYAFNL